MCVSTVRTVECTKFTVERTNYIFRALGIKGRMSRSALAHKYGEVAYWDSRCKWL